MLDSYLKVVIHGCLDRAKAWLAVFAAGVAAAVCTQADESKLLNVSYDPTREF